MLSSFVPAFTASDILACQFSSWYKDFAPVSIRSTIIPLSAEFLAYLDEDGVFVPEGSEGVTAENGYSSGQDDGESDEEEDTRHHSFPELDARIRAVVAQYGGVFPKLNFTSPKDVAWVLPPSSPLKCTSPADVYLLLKSSDFIPHDLHASSVFEGCTDASSASADYQLELVLKKWYSVDRSREFRCFVRNNALIGICQRDVNFYDYMLESETRDKIRSTVMKFWTKEVKKRWKGGENYIFDILYTRDLSRAHIVDFNPYAPRTDTLLFSYENLEELHAKNQSSLDPDTIPELRTITSHGEVASAPINQHNMVPLEALSLGADQGAWADAIQEAVHTQNAEDDD